MFAFLKAATILRQIVLAYFSLHFSYLLTLVIAYACPYQLLIKHTVNIFIDAE